MMLKHKHKQSSRATQTVEVVVQPVMYLGTNGRDRRTGNKRTPVFQKIRSHLFFRWLPLTACHLLRSFDYLTPYVTGKDECLGRLQPYLISVGRGWRIKYKRAAGGALTQLIVLATTTVLLLAVHVDWSLTQVYGARGLRLRLSEQSVDGHGLGQMLRRNRVISGMAELRTPTKASQARAGGA